MKRSYLFFKDFVVNRLGKSFDVGCSSPMVITAERIALFISSSTVLVQPIHIGWIMHSLHHGVVEQWINGNFNLISGCAEAPPE